MAHQNAEGLSVKIAKHKEEVESKLETLLRRVKAVDPMSETNDWGDLGSLAHVNELLGEITAFYK